jgi:hypothetical protein
LDPSKTMLVHEEREGLLAFCEAMKETLGEGLTSICLYGSALREGYAPGKSDINVLVVLEKVDVGTLRSLRGPVVDGRGVGISPFFITHDNLRTAADVFPIKFWSIREGHQLLVGRDVLEGIDIDEELLCLRLRQEMVTTLMRMRRYYFQRGGRGLTQLMANITPGLMENLRVAVFLVKGGMPTRDEAIPRGAEAFGLDPGTLRSLASLRRREASLPPEESDRLFDGVIAMVDKLLRALEKQECETPGQRD